VKELQNTIQDVKKEIDLIEERKGLLKRDIENLENDKTDLEAELEDRE